MKVLKAIQATPLVYHTTINAQGNYKIVIPLDNYLPGKCQWQPWKTEYQLASTPKQQVDTNSLIRYGERTDRIPRYYNIACYDNAQDCDIKIPKGYYDTFTLSRKKSQTIHFNLVYRSRKTP